MVHNALSENQWLRQQGAKLEPQGSFTNRTNTRLDADIDLRVQHPYLRIEYAPGVSPMAAWSAGRYQIIDSPLEHLVARMRWEIQAELVRKFGRTNVELGKKAIRVKGLAGSRSEVDVVPAITFHSISRSATSVPFFTTIGVTILSTEGTWTINYPEQHLANGRAKRRSTGYQFKRVVRIIKRLRADMSDRGILTARVPSFLIECLVYNVADKHFLAEGETLYDRVKRVLTEIGRQLNVGILSPFLMVEVNGIKSLFGEGQAWTVEDARTFIKLAVTHLGDC